MTVIVVEDDRLLRTLEVALDAELSPGRLAAVADYFAHDGVDIAAWRNDVRSRAAALLPVTLRFVATQEALRAALPGAHAVVVEGLAVGRAELDAADRLALVCKFGAIADNIDAVACAARRVPLRLIRRRTNLAVAEFTLACMLELCRNAGALNGRVTAARISAHGPAYRAYDKRYAGMNNYARAGGARNLADATVGILGMGEIGREVARRVRAFGANVVYAQRRRLAPAVEDVLGMDYRPLGAMFAEADIVTLHVPLSPQSRGLVDRDLLSRMKPGSFLVNTSRAPLIDRQALMEALESGRIGAAALDVHYEEPVTDADPILAFPNVLLTPHVAGGSRRNITGDLEEVIFAVGDAVERRPNAAALASSQNAGS